MDWGVAKTLWKKPMVTNWQASPNKNMLFFWGFKTEVDGEGIWGEGNNENTFFIIVEERGERERGWRWTIGCVNSCSPTLLSQASLLINSGTHSSSLLQTHSGSMEISEGQAVLLSTLAPINGQAYNARILLGPDMKAHCQSVFINELMECKTQWVLPLWV